MRWLYRAVLDVLSLDKDETHDVEVTLDQDAGLLRLLVTLSDSRLAPGQSQGHGDDGRTSAGSRQPIGQPLARPANHSAASAKYAVSKNNRQQQQQQQQLLLLLLLLILLLLLHPFHCLFSTITQVIPVPEM